MGAGHLFRTVQSPLEMGDWIFWKPPRPDQTKPNWGLDQGSLDWTTPDGTSRTRPDQTVPDQTEPSHIGLDRPDWTRPDQNFTMGLPWRPVGLPWKILNKKLYETYKKMNKNCKKDIIKLNFCTTVRLEILYVVRI